MADTLVCELLLQAAERDACALRALSGHAEVHDAVLGFHAQQAAEKSLKAVLAWAMVAFRRTHDLAELMDMLADNGLPSPPFADRLDELTPYAVEARYSLIDPGGVTRTEMSVWTAAVIAWASAVVAGTGSGRGTP